MRTPMIGSHLPWDRLWAADTGCFNKPDQHDNERYLAWLTRKIQHRDRCLFATAPDVVGNAEATLERSRPMLARIRELSFPAALVGQDGMAPNDVPWREIDALFLGGTTAWKLGPQAIDLARAARAHGKWLHMGRVNSLRRMRAAQAMGCDSVDGTFIAFGPDLNTRQLIRWLKAIQVQPLLEGLG